MSNNTDDTEHTIKNAFKKTAYKNKAESYENTILRNEKREAKKETQRKKAIEQGQRPNPPPPPIQKYISTQITTAARIFEMSSTSLSKTTIKDKYKELALRNHPDKGGNKDKFIQIKNAYDVLITYIGNEP